MYHLFLVSNRHLYHPSPISHRYPYHLLQTTDTCNHDSEKISFRVSGAKNPKQTFSIENARTVKSLNLPKQTFMFDELKRTFSHLKFLPVESYSQVSPTILIGIDNLNLTSPINCREGTVGQPIAIKSRLGCSVCGPCDDKFVDHSNERFTLHMCECKTDENLEQLMKEFFAVEAIGAIKSTFMESADETRARNILEKTTVRQGDRFESGLLWKTDVVELPNSLPMAKRRLQCLNTKCPKNRN